MNFWSASRNLRETTNFDSYIDSLFDKGFFFLFCMLVNGQTQNNKIGIQSSSWYGFLQIYHSNQSLLNSTHSNWLRNLAATKCRTNWFHNHKCIWYLNSINILYSMHTIVQHHFHRSIALNNVVMIGKAHNTTNNKLN